MVYKKLYQNLQLIKKEAVVKNYKTALVITVTTKPTDQSITLFPIRYLDDYVCLPIGIISDVIGKKLTKYFDGKVDAIFVDSENKILKCQNIFKKIFEVVNKSKIYAIKGNDFSADSAFSLISTLLKPVVGKRICIVGAGNIGGKLALKLIECGAKVFIINSTKKSTLKMTNAINVMKPKKCMQKVLPVRDKNFPKQLDCIIGFTRGNPAITKKMIEQVKNNGLVLDGGSGTISNDAIDESKRKKLKMMRLDVRLGFISQATLMINTEKFFIETYGIKKFSNFNIIAGGYFGDKGDIVVDNIKSPKKIIGVSDGKGGLLKSHTKFKHKIKKINDFI